MTLLKERQKSLLLKTADWYIKLARPISSEFLKKKCRLSLSPATIRLEMQRLDKEGFLYQPHCSSGRVPTSRGFRFFVNHLLECGVKEIEIKNWKEQELKKGILSLWSFLKKMSTTSHCLSLVFLKEQKEFFQEGWVEVLKEPEFKNKTFLQEFLSFSKKIESFLKTVEMKSDFEIFIGEEIPIKEGKSFSVILLEVFLEEFGTTIFSLCGPQRMNYNRNIGILLWLRKRLKNYGTKKYPK
ncbi:hypothetical protein H5T58_00590 [Candidatus Parcubacteria bacterium]|nr:hypothetical protein [Candidatus Parcubacteria bacterium]